MADIPTTQRAYTLRLTRIDKHDQSWHDRLWKTHESVNRGAKVFGDWLLTLRGGISHSLADAPVQDGKKTCPPTAIERRNRRIVLALSWLSVESLTGAPDKRFHVDALKTSEALVAILRGRQLPGDEIDSWAADCRASLQAAIRDAAVWVNRSAMFDEAVPETGSSLGRDDVWDLFDRFFGGVDSYFEGIALESDDAEESSGGEEYKAKDLAQKARGWLSNRFGSGRGADFTAVLATEADVQAEAKRQLVGRKEPRI